MQCSALGLTLTAVALAAVTERTAAAVALIGASALFALKIGLVTGAQTARVALRPTRQSDVTPPTPSIDALHDVRARVEATEHSAMMIRGRLDALEERKESETVFDRRAENVIAQTATMQFELARIAERLAIIERQLGVPDREEIHADVPRDPSP